MRRSFGQAVLVLILACSLTVFASPGIAENSDIGSSFSSADPASHNSTPSEEQVNELDEATVLLVRDVTGWSTANEQILLSMPDVTLDIINSASLATTDLTPYTFIVIAGDQTADFNTNVNNSMTELGDYVDGGGWLQMHFGTNTHTPHLTLWDGTTYGDGTYFEQQNFLGPDGDGHPILAGMTEPFEGNYANHGYMTVYPDESLIITVTSTDQPTFIEYDYGQGKVVCSTSPLEFNYPTYGFGQALWNMMDWMVNRPPAGPVILTLTGTTTEVPPGGGTIMYDLAFESELDITYPGVRYWTMVELPNGQIYGPLFQQMFTLTPFMNVNIIGLTQNIPMFAPPGTYTFYGYAGLQPGPFVEDSFDFNKTGTAAEGIDNWNAGGSFTIAGDDAATVSVLPSEFELQSVYPNPFNPATTVSVALPQSAELSVAVFNVTGQKVADLAGGRFSAGRHKFTFDASALTSGIYFVRAIVPGELNAVEKITLLK